MANPTLQDVIEAIQDKVIATGIKYAPDYIPSNLPGQWPAVITRPMGGKAKTGDAGVHYYLHNIRCDVHFPITNISNAEEQAMPFIEKIIEAIANDPWLNENCEPMEEINYEFLQDKSVTPETLCIRFVVRNIKMYPYGKQ